MLPVGVLVAVVQGSMLPMLRTTRRLQWRMTCSYVLVTIPALVLMQACFLALIGGAFYAFINSQLLAEEQATALGMIAPQAAHYLGSPTPDGEELSRWLRGTMCSSAAEATMWAANTYPAVELTTIVDAQGRVVADATGNMQPGTRLSDRLDQHATRVLQAALSGHTSPQLLALRRPDNGIVAASPIKDAQQRVLGAWLVHLSSTPMPTRGESLWILLLLLVPLSIMASCFVIGLGSIYGWLTSRNLVHRLRGLSLAADAWSAGDFQAVAPDRSEDELGYLSRRFNQMAAKLQTLVSTRQELATLEERNRLARELHDSVKQQLFAISMQLASARTLVAGQTPADGLLAHAESLTQQAQREVTATINALRPAALPEAGIVEALRAMVPEWSQQHAIVAELECQGRPELPPVAEQALLRVAQEALANVARHSQATHVSVNLVAKQQICSLSIADNGRGFDASSPAPHGIGLQSMRERVASCGGSLAVDSRPGAGTRITARFPVGRE